MTAWNGIAIACDDGRQEGSVRRKVGQSVNIVRQIEASALVLDISMLTSIKIDVKSIHYSPTNHVGLSMPQHSLMVTRCTA